VEEQLIQVLQVSESFQVLHQFTDAGAAIRQATPAGAVLELGKHLAIGHGVERMGATSIAFADELSPVREPDSDARKHPVVSGLFR